MTSEKAEENTTPSVVPNYLPVKTDPAPKNVNLPLIRVTNPDSTELLGTLIEAARQHMTMKQIAEALGVRPQTVYNAKSKKRRSKISLGWFINFCNVTGTRFYVNSPKAQKK